MLGLSTGEVVLSAYNERWKKLFLKEKRLLHSVIGEIVIEIQHVGSTAIPGLKAKPIIDIAVAVDKLEKGESCIQPLTEIGYEYRNDAGISGRHFFVKGHKENRTHYLHIEELDSRLWKNHILFRNYLRENEEVRKEYQALKERLAEQYKNNRELYTVSKAKFIKGVIAIAEAPF